MFESADPTGTALFFWPMNFSVHRYRTLASTNVLALELGQAGAAHGEVIVAASQSAGRGRLGKQWSSPPGKGLYFSIILRPQLEPEEFPQLTMTAGVAVAQVLEEVCQLQALLKWPNDIYIADKKCCGILTEASFKGEDEADLFAVIGIGLNVLTDKEDFPTELQKTATSLYIETGIQYELDALMHSIHARVLDMVSMQREKGFSAILTQWKARDYLLGKTLQWVTHSGGIVYGVSLGPDENGELLVRDDAGDVHKVLSGDVQLAR